MNTVVNTVTGEITETTALATVDPSSAVAVTSYLEQAKTWLATAVENTGPEQIARAKAEIATAAEMARQLSLSKEIQIDAEEMVRRAEFTIAKSVRQGQERGEILSRTNGGFHGNQHGPGQGPDGSMTSPSEFFTNHKEQAESYALSDGVTPEEFDAALAEAKAEGNLSRANVVRKVKGQKAGVITRDMRAEMIRNLADQGVSSRQMPAKVGVTEETVRLIAKDFDIEIPADRVILKTRRHNSHRIAFETVTALEGLAMGVDLINYDEIDPQEARQWADSLNHSLRAINRFHKQIKETTHD